MYPFCRHFEKLAAERHVNVTLDTENETGLGFTQRSHYQFTMNIAPFPSLTRTYLVKS